MMLEVHGRDLDATRAETAEARQALDQVRRPMRRGGRGAAAVRLGRLAGR
jgi:hypothetical protein